MPATPVVRLLHLRPLRRTGGLLLVPQHAASVGGATVQSGQGAEASDFGLVSRATGRAPSSVNATSDALTAASDRANPTAAQQQRADPGAPAPAILHRSVPASSPPRRSTLRARRCSRGSPPPRCCQPARTSRWSIPPPVRSAARSPRTDPDLQRHHGVADDRHPDQDDDPAAVTANQIQADVLDVENELHHAAMSSRLPVNRSTVETVRPR